MVPHPIAERLERITRGRLLSVDAYHRLIETGVLGEDDRVELLDGELVAMSPQSRAHANMLVRLTAMLDPCTRFGLHVRAQLPLTFLRSEPEPDLAVVSGPPPESLDAAHPVTALLVIEVSLDSLASDRTRKAAIYAEAGIAEYWIVDLAGRRVEVRRGPDAATRAYRTLEIAAPPGALRPLAAPDLSIDLTALFR